MKLQARLAMLYGIGLGCGIATDLASQVPTFAEWHAPVERLIAYPDGPHHRGLIADFNLDGVPDIVHPWMPTFFTGPRDIIHVWLSDGIGSFVAGTPIQFPATPFGITFAVMACVAVDLDSDGDLELIAAFVGGDFGTTVWGPMLTFENDGTGKFTLEPIWRFPPSFRSVCRELLAFDVDQDGDDDVIMLPFWNEGFPTLFRNDGRGYFQEVPGALPPVSPLWGNCIAVDLDHDGDLDFVGTTRGTIDRPEIWLNDGNGLFLPASHGIPVMSADDVDFGDVDRDGHVDLLFGAYGLRPQLWLGDGRGAFVDSTHRVRIVAGLSYHEMVQLVDFDRDGWLDILYLEHGVVRLQRNPGPGSGIFDDFTPRLIPQGSSGNARFIDTDRDGDLDLLVGTIPSTHILTNLARQIHANDPSPGGQLDIDLYGPPGNLASYALSFARHDLRLPGLGWWALDPTLSVSWPQTVTLPASGTVRSSWSIPNDPGLIGVEVFVQSMQIDVSAQTPHLTGFWKSTIRR